MRKTNKMSHKKFVTRLGLFDVWDKFPVDFTHTHTDFKSVSTIDRILVNERLLSYITDAGVIHLADNPSRHDPIMMKLNIGKIPAQVYKPEVIPRRPAWYKATDMEIDQYTACLHSKISNLEIPASLSCEDPHCQDSHHSEERDHFVLDILTAIVETSHQIIPITGGGTRKVHPEKKCPIGQAIPSWREHVEPFREDALFWHGVWLSADHPNTGALYNIMTSTRNKYHYAIRRVKRRADQIRANNLFEASKAGDIDLLNEMKKLNGKKTGGSLPECVEGADTPSDIVDKFKEVYESLYNSVPSDIHKLLEKLVIDGDTSFEVNKVTGAKVKEAACRLKPGKSDVSGGYTSYSTVWLQS